MAVYEHRVKAAKEDMPGFLKEFDTQLIKKAKIDCGVHAKIVGLKGETMLQIYKAISM